MVGLYLGNLSWSWGTVSTTPKPSQLEGPRIAGPGNSTTTVSGSQFPHVQNGNHNPSCPVKTRIKGWNQDEQPQPEVLVSVSSCRSSEGPGLQMGRIRLMPSAACRILCYQVLC